MTPERQRALRILLELKRASDNRDYRTKHQLARQVESENPGQFIIDSEENGIVGITHVPTGFRFHLPRKVTSLSAKEAYLDGYKEAQGPAVDPDRKLAAQLYKLLVQRPELEGFRDRVYPDASGKRLPTIGYGINLRDPGNQALLTKLFGEPAVRGWQAGQPMSQAQAGHFVQQRALLQDIPSLRRKLPTYSQLPESSRLALLSMHWNSPKLVGPNLQRFIQEKNWPAASGEIAYGHSGTLPGLIKRRIFEAGEFGKGFKLSPVFEETRIEKRKAAYDDYMNSLKPAAKAPVK